MPHSTLRLAPDPNQVLSLQEGFALESLELLEELEAFLLSLEGAPWDASLWQRMLGPLHTLRSNAAGLSLEPYFSLASRLEGLVDWLHRSRTSADHATIGVMLETVDALREACHRDLRGLAPQSRPGPNPRAQQTPDMNWATQPELPAPPPQSQAPLPSPAALNRKLELALKRLHGHPDAEVLPLGELLIQQGKLRPEDLETVLALQRQPTGALLVALGLSTAEAVTDALDQQRRQGQPRVALRVEARRLERLTSLATSLLARCAQTESLARSVGGSPALAESLSELRRQVRSLWGEATAMRQVPLVALFQRLERTASELSRRLDRPVEISIQGEQLQLEVEYLDALGPVLPSVVINALQHGLESPAERRARGKPEIGRLILSASSQGGELTLVVADDGRGLDAQQVRARALSMGLPDPTYLEDSRRWSVLFEPGFGSQESPEALGSHGYGLSTVRDAVQRVGGSVWLESQPGVGTGLYIQLLTRAGMLDGVVVVVSGNRLVLPARAILEYVRPTWSQCQDLNGPIPRLELRGTSLPLVWLGLRLGLPPSGRTLWDSLVVVVETLGGPLGLVVDDLTGPQRVPTPVGPADVPGLSGQVVLENGEVAGLVSLETLLRQ